ncbi:phosphoribosyltransferase family protein [Arthrobacter sp. zg-Y820]|uniref:phosphoribosyltransferase n=1 Tax=unclassified Arthrobacter TaxID=235627 RepID=UPI001E4BA29B|nr:MULTISPECIES: phosphoribosyltransferase family protein [unclassified Arthrobacter]MCC9197102.1 phosphoribosyl transferase [Arthrobacter sp. zg-Y820]MDK1279967.1 phosphoribosyltransferase family protein [Arthrobacter sp. zg.Y820]MDK1361655.1 phosphoribosyltransferase family protein [Arthrobacter sp. zg-Y1219]WIB09266.1 phosphoribosyltransferase family protein [Arthrobacter sp. zg-Y820]
MAPLRLYRDRQDAGRKLGVELAPYFGTPNLLVLGLPRGGVPVAAAVAGLLRAPLDVVAVRKVGVPLQPELAAGALAWLAGTVTSVRNEAVLAEWQRSLGSSREHDPRAADQAFDDAASVELLEVIRRDKLYRMRRDPLDVSGRTVLVVDDGLATGSTMRAALLGLREQNPARLVAAAPVSCGTAGEAAAAVADDVVIPWQSGALSAVGQAYESFDQTTDAEVQRLLNLP